MTRQVKSVAPLIRYKRTLDAQAFVFTSSIASAGLDFIHVLSGRQPLIIMGLQGQVRTPVNDAEGNPIEKQRCVQVFDNGSTF